MANGRDLDIFSTDDVNADIASASEGTFVALPDLTAIGITDMPRACQNYVEGFERAKKAMSVGCYMEVIDLRVQHVDMWLRLLLVYSAGAVRIIPPDDKRTFGTVIEECSRRLPPDLLNRLRKFNQTRIEAVHKYLLGGTDYEALKVACDESRGLDTLVYNFVIRAVGKPISSAEGRIGELIVRLNA